MEDQDFPIISGPELSPLEIRKDLGVLDRNIAFLKELSSRLQFSTIHIMGEQKKGYIPISIIDNYEKIYLRTSNHPYLEENLSLHDPTHKISYNFNILTDVCYDNYSIVSPVNGYKIILSEKQLTLEGYTYMKFVDNFVYIRKDYWDIFKDKFQLYISDDADSLSYNNLIHLVIMVKDAGNTFRKVLEENLPYIDRWTILDTGSTDGTQDVIREVLGKRKEGTLYEEPFINFKDSRNRALELAGKSCVFNIMLDDTYILREGVREFLDKVRGDDVADSYSLYIREQDMTYSSNRITKSALELRYIYKIHEIIEPNYNVAIPSHVGHIEDLSSSYMTTRTNNRKQKDLQWLREEIEENPDNPRHYYYMAETYLCIKDWGNAYKWYRKRAEHLVEGYIEEKYDAIYKSAVMADLYLHHPWKNCQDLYLQAYEFDNSRAESIFQLGWHYLGKDDDMVYMYFSRAFEIGLPPRHYNMNIKTDMYCYHLPKFLCDLCYKNQNFTLGRRAAERWVSYRPEPIVHNWLKLFILLEDSKRHDNLEKEGVEYIAVIVPNVQDIKREYISTLWNSFEENVPFVIYSTEHVNNYPCIDIKEYPRNIHNHNIKFTFIVGESSYVGLTTNNNIQTCFILPEEIIPNQIIPIHNSLTYIIASNQENAISFSEIYPEFRDKIIIVPNLNLLSSWIRVEN